MGCSRCVLCTRCALCTLRNIFLNVKTCARLQGLALSIVAMVSQSWPWELQGLPCWAFRRQLLRAEPLMVQCGTHPVPG